jgi:Tfp pilus assembly protein PilX
MNTRHRPQSGSSCRQRGTALLVAMVLLLGVTLISLASVNGSMAELRMASNVEGNTNTFQTALAAIDFVISDTSHLPTTGELGVPHSVTPSGAPFTVTGDDSITAEAARVEDCAPPPRATAATSLIGLSAFSYEVTVQVNKNDSGMGQSKMTQGYVVLGPKCS